MLPTATQSRIHSPGLKLTNALKCSIKWLSRLWKKTWISWHAEWRYVFSCELLPYAGAGNWAAETLQKRNLFFVLMYLGQSRNKENLPDRIIGIWKCWFFGVNRNTRRKIFWSKEKTKNKLKPHAYDAEFWHRTRVTMVGDHLLRLPSLHHLRWHRYDLQRSYIMITAMLN